MSRVPGAKRVPAQDVGCHDDPGTGTRLDCTSPLPQTEAACGGSEKDGGGRKAAEETVLQERGSEDS